MELPLHSQVGVAPAGGAWRSNSPEDGEVRSIDIQLQVVWQAIVELVVGGVLPDVGVLKLQSIQFVEELKVPFPLLRNRGIVGIERELSEQRLRDRERAHQQ